MFHRIKSKCLFDTAHQGRYGARQGKTYPAAGVKGTVLPGDTHTRGTKLTLYSSSSPQTVRQVSLGESEFTLRASGSYRAVHIYIFRDLPESSLHQLQPHSLLRCFSVILMAGFLFTAEALIWGYAMSKFKRQILRSKNSRGTIHGTRRAHG